MRRFAALAIGCALAGPVPASATPLTVDRLLAQEQLGAVKLDATRRWLVVQRYGRWDKAPVFDLAYYTNLGIAQIQVFDMAHGAVERRLSLPRGSGYTALGVSPGGRRLAVGRLTLHAYELGVVDLASGRARWLGISPVQPLWGPSVAWRGDDELLVAARPAGFPDTPLGFGYMGQDRLNEKWAASAKGQAAVTAIGSGKYLGLRAKAPVVGLVSVDVTTGANRVVIPGDVSDFELSPDGASVAAIVAGEDFQAPVSELTTAASEMWRKRLAIADLKSGQVRYPCATCEIMPRLLSWSDDGEGLLVFARQGQMAFSEDGRYWRFDRKGNGRPLDMPGLTPALEDTWDTVGSPRAGWLDGAPVVRAKPVDGGRVDYWRVSGDTPSNLTAALPAVGRLIGRTKDAWAVSAGDRVWRVTAGGAGDWNFKVADLVRLADPPPGFRAQFGFTPNLGDLGLSDRAQPVAPWPGPRLGYAGSGQARAASPLGVVDVVKDAHGVRTVGLTPSGGARRVLATVNAALADVDAAQPVAIHHKSQDGRDLVSWLYLPVDARRGPRPPVVVLPYPGTVTATAPAAQEPGEPRFLINAQMLAADGYAALVPSLPYIPGKEPMDGLADQILAPVDAAADLGLVDRDRIAAWGHSYGGYAVVAAATQSRRFKAIVASAPTVNLISAYGRLGPVVGVVPEMGLSIAAATGWQETGQARMVVPPWKDPQLYLRNSPITYVDRITAPMLILYGDNDKAIDQAQTLFSSLFRLNRDAIFVTYHKETHVWGSPGNIRDQYARVFQLLDETIGAPQLPAR